MRAQVLRLRGAQIGRKTRIGPRCEIQKPWCLIVGERAEIEADVYIKITNGHAHVRIGSYTFVGKGVEIDVSHSVEIGAHSLLAPRCFLTDHAHSHSLREQRIDQQGCQGAPVRVGDDCWLGTGTTVLMGVSIGDGAVVGAHSVVRRDIAPCEVHAGTPARKIGERR
jgi:acetyltransferase-like isoleucine patch superfamily enzyme